MQNTKIKRVFYLTGCMPAIASLALGRLKVSRFSDLNDPFELMGVNVGDKAVRKAFKATRDKLNEERGMICFTTNWKNPLMWGHYAEKHAGMALGFDVPSDMLTEVTYAKKLFDLKLDPMTKKPGPGTVERLISTKFYDWGYEKEVRMFVALDLDAAEGGMHFVPFSDELKLREIVLGPRCVYKIEDLRALAARVSEKPIDVTKARIAFTRFEVLENLAATRADGDLGD